MSWRTREHEELWMEISPEEIQYPEEHVNTRSCGWKFPLKSSNVLENA
jgi:hypothetical protein